MMMMEKDDSVKREDEIMKMREREKNSASILVPLFFSISFQILMIKGMNMMMMRTMIIMMWKMIRDDDGK